MEELPNDKDLYRMCVINDPSFIVTCLADYITVIKTLERYTPEFQEMYPGKIVLPTYEVSNGVV